MTGTIIALILFLFPLAYSPGPGNLFFAANGARFGFRATIPANAGYHAATWVVTAAVGLGLITALEDAPHVFLALKTVGGFYVLWLAWRLFRAGAVDTGAAARPAGFLDGGLLLILNPKAYVIIALMFTQFLDPAGGERLRAVLLITTVFTLNNLLAFCAWTLIGDRIAGHVRVPERVRRLNSGFGVILAGVAVWMILP